MNIYLVSYAFISKPSSVLLFSVIVSVVLIVVFMFLSSELTSSEWTRIYTIE